MWVLFYGPGFPHPTFPAPWRIQDLFSEESVSFKTEKDGEVVGPCEFQGRKEPSPQVAPGILQTKIESFLQHPHGLLLDSWWSASRQWGIGRPGN